MSRVRALAARGVDISRLEIVTVAPNLLEKAQAAELAKAIGPADVIIFDTLAAVTPAPTFILSAVNVTLS